MNRDPRHDPKRGDIVLAAGFSNKRKRCVTDLSKNYVAYDLVTAEKTVRKFCSIGSWRRWCMHESNKVSIIQTGDE